MRKLIQAGAVFAAVPVTLARARGGRPSSGAAARATAAALGAICFAPGHARVVLMCALSRESAVEALLAGSETWGWKDDEAEIVAAIRWSKGGVVTQNQPDHRGVRVNGAGERTLGPCGFRRSGLL